MQEEFDDVGSVVVKMALQIVDGAETPVPDILFGMLAGKRQVFLFQYRGMHPGDQHFFIVRAIENADLAALRQIAGGAPEKIMRQLLGAGMLEAEDLAALRIDT